MRGSPDHSLRLGRERPSCLTCRPTQCGRRTTASPCRLTCVRRSATRDSAPAAGRDRYAGIAHTLWMTRAGIGASSTTQRKPPGGQRRPSVGSSSRHSSPVSPLAEHEATIRGWCHTLSAYCDARGLPREVAYGLVHQLLREPAPAPREERPKPRAVADQHHRPPVGYRTKAHLELEVQREGGLPNKPRRD